MMKRRFVGGGIWRTTLLCVLGSLAVGLLTFSSLRLQLGFFSVSFCYLLLIVGHALAGDLASSAVVSLLSAVCLDYFFVEPLFSFRVQRPVDILGLASFLITGLIITNLVTKVRSGTALSRLHHERLQRLYDLSQQLLALDPDTKGGGQFLEPFKGVFGIRACCLLDAINAEIYITGEAGDDLEKKTGEAFIRGEDCRDESKGLVARCIRVGSRTIGAIGFEGLSDPDSTAGPLAALAAAHLERMHTFIRISLAAAAAQTEAYRSAILDALAHEFKTPLSTIMTAAGALREDRSLGTDHREMAEIVEFEAARLGRLTSRLIRTARLERAEVRPWIEVIDVCSVIAETVDQYDRRSGERRIAVIKECELSEVMADPELLRLAVSQLLDNACKYSRPGLGVTLRISREGRGIAVRVFSSGNPIPLAERNKIFDRFYRGIDGRRVGPGSGLGLFVARKIALALGGALELEEDHGDFEGTVFRLDLPVPVTQGDHLAEAV
jgi:two-component system, OmpR family, sensor histidine kinase KdpD